MHARWHKGTVMAGVWARQHKGWPGQEREAVCEEGACNSRLEVAGMASNGAGQEKDGRLMVA